MSEGTKARSWYHPNLPRHHGAFKAVSGTPGPDYAPFQASPGRLRSELMQCAFAGPSQLTGPSLRRKTLCFSPSTPFYLPKYFTTFVFILQAVYSSYFTSFSMRSARPPMSSSMSFALSGSAESSSVAANIRRLSDARISAACCLRCFASSVTFFVAVAYTSHVPRSKSSNISGTSML